MTWFQDILQNHGRVAIAGGPKTGKTTLTIGVTDRLVHHGDDWIYLGWSESSEHIAVAVNNNNYPVVVEGVQVPRALRKGMRVNCVIWLSIPHMALTENQQAMTNGCGTVMREWLGGREMTPIDGVPGAALLVLT